MEFNLIDPAIQCKINKGNSKFVQTNQEKLSVFKQQFAQLIMRISKESSVKEMILDRENRFI